MTDRMVALTVLVRTSTLQKLESKAKSNEKSLSATARELIEKGLLESGA